MAQESFHRDFYAKAEGQFYSGNNIRLPHTISAAVSFNVSCKTLYSPLMYEFITQICIRCVTLQIRPDLRMLNRVVCYVKSSSTSDRTTTCLAGVKGEGVGLFTSLTWLLGCPPRSTKNVLKKAISISKIVRFDLAIARFIHTIHQNSR